MTIAIATILSNISTNLLPTTGKYLLIILPIALPLTFLYIWWNIRFKWVTMKFVSEQKPCLLEIKLPKEISKSPAAMEMFFLHLAQGGAGDWKEAFLQGKTRPWFSCEIASIGGVVRFFIWCSQAKYKNLVEAQLYAQYPNLEIFESEDYTKDFYFDAEKYSISTTQYTLTKADPFPIKTYVEYGLDRDQKDEYKIDPITSLIEYLGSLKKGENAWIQILIQKHEKEAFLHGRWWSEGKDLKKEIKNEIAKIKKAAAPKDDSKSNSLSKSDMEVISAIERTANKTPFDCMIRSVYIAETAAAVPINIGGLIGGLKQYGSNNLNGFKPGVSKSKSDLFHAYKLRSYFQPPFKNYGGSKPFVLTTEELATIFHFVGGVVSQTPTLQRVGSKKSEAPANLPI